MIFSLIIVGTIAVLSIPGAIVFIPLTVLTGNVNPLYRVGSWIAHVALLLGGIRFRIEGRERVPRGVACIFMANHVSNLDPPILLPRIPRRSSAFLKKSLMKVPFLGYAMKLGEFVPVSRDGSVESAKESIAAARRVLEKGIHITTFVEGTRSRDGRLLPFKKGPFYLAHDTGAPCVPISIYGTETMMAKNSLKILPGTAHVIFHDPIWPKDYANRDELMKAVRASIASGLPEWMRG